MKDGDVYLAMLAMKDMGDKAIEDLQKKADAIVQAVQEEIGDFLSANGRTRCPKCSGHGAIERLDSGYMKRFGLREWDGCTNCGGSRDKKGLGFVSISSDILPDGVP